MKYNVGMFTGIETFNWQISDFDTLIANCKSWGITQIVLKVYEITQGDWYQHLGGSTTVIGHIKDSGLDVLPYGYFYGNDISNECAAIKRYLSLYGKFCANMEAEWNNNPAKTQEFKNSLGTFGGQLYISTWADPETQAWLQNISILEPITYAFMPEAYDDNLVKLMYSQFPRLKTAKILPTFEIGLTSPAMAGPFIDFTLWEYQEALANPQAVKDFIKVVQSNPNSDDLLKQMTDIWNANMVGVPITTGIANVWKQAYEAGVNCGFPTCREITTVDKNGDTVIIQYFAGGIFCEHDSKLQETTFYLPTGVVIFKGTTKA